MLSASLNTRNMSSRQFQLSSRIKTKNQRGQNQYASKAVRMNRIRETISQVLFVVFLVAAASSCGTSDFVEDRLEFVEDTFDFDHYITSDDTTITFRSGDGNNLFIRSNRSTITILSDSDLGDVFIEGDNCLVTFEHPISIESLNFEGSDNVVNVPIGSGITISSDSGSGNSLIQY